MEINSKSTFQEVQVWASIFLEYHNHIEASGQQYIQWLMDWTLTDYVSHLQKPVGQTHFKFLFNAFHRIVEDYPLAYILGYQDFRGRRFKVTQDTLIPREETSGLIDLASPFLTNHPQAKVLDIGTGTGVLAISIKNEFPETFVTGLDISSQALAVARENGHRLSVDVNWVLSDLMDGLPAEQTFDLIISNPPYISSDEIHMMDQSVIKYEPRLALFAEKQGLDIYEKIAKQLSNRLNPGGLALLEIGYKQAKAVEEIFNHIEAIKSCRIFQDINGLDRFVQVEV